MKILIELFISFFKVGAFSFGGGYAMLPLLEKEVIQLHGWMTSTEFIDIFAISEMTPGPIAVNSATFLGYKMAGIMGAIVATFAVVLPSFIAISLIFASLVKFENSPYVDWIFKGIRPIVLGLILAAGITVARTSLGDIKSIFIGILLFCLVTFKDFNPIWGIVLAGTLGIIFF